MPKAPKTPKKSSVKQVKARGLVNHYYYAYMPKRKHHRILLWVVFFIAVIIIGFQMAYPQDRSLPHARLGGAYVGLKNHNDLAKVIEEKFQQSKIQLRAGDKISASYDTSLAGSEPDSEYMIQRMTEYPFLVRLIPLSILLQPAGIDNFSLSYTKSIQSKFSEDRSREMSVTPSNAGVEIKNGKLVSTRETSGIEVKSSDISAALENSQIPISNSTITIDLKYKSIPALKTTKDFQAISQQANNALARKIVLKYEGQIFIPEPNQRASWLKIGADGKNNTILSIDEEAVKRYLEYLNQKIGHNPGQTNINIVNGRETARQTGEKGLEINYPAVVDSISKSLILANDREDISIIMQEVDPTVIYNNRYTATEEGLKAYVSDASKRGAWISIQQIGGNNWSAASRENESIPSASTYKLFVALLLFDKMDKGEVGWTDPILDTDVSGCFNRMTIASTNPCAQEWLGRYGRSNVNDFVYRHGFSRGTDFNNPVATHTTAADLTKFMIGLYDGSLISGAHRDRLYHSLSIHPYRYGIPTGSAANEVYDKVGFLWDYVHDTAIVYHPRGTYVMTIMTKGQSYAAIAGMTREIERIMFP